MDTIQIQYITSKEGLKSALLDALSEISFIQAPEIKSVKPPATLQEGCRFLNISPPTIRTLIRTHQLKSFYIGRQVRIRWSDLEDFVNKRNLDS
jgi:excisionase family DNA binding protein